MSEQHNPPETAESRLYDTTLGEVIAQLVSEFKGMRQSIDEVRDTLNLDKEALLREHEARILAEAEGDIVVLRRNLSESEGEHGNETAGDGVPVTGSGGGDPGSELRHS